jgi:hypothetical protein
MQEAFEEQKIKGAYGKHTGENDLGKCFYYYRNYVVEYYAPNGRYRVRNGSVFYDLTSSFIINRKAIIIGNVTDNPELLGGEGVMAELLPCPFCGSKAERKTLTHA